MWIELDLLRVLVHRLSPFSILTGCTFLIPSGLQIDPQLVGVRLRIEGTIFNSDILALGVGLRCFVSA